MVVELRERKWCAVLGIEKVGVEGCLICFAIAYGLIRNTFFNLKLTFILRENKKNR